MQYVHVHLDQPDWMRHPMQRFLASTDALERVELHAWNHSREDAQFALFYVAGDVDAYRDRITDVEAIRWYELTPVDADSFYSYVCQEYTESDVAFMGAFAELSLVVVPPLVYDADGVAAVTVVGRGEALSTLVEQLREDAGVGVDVMEIGSYDRRYGGVAGGLTDRQFEALETATELGYYAAPRRASLAAVADELGVTGATASELLRRAESAVMRRVVDASPADAE